MRKVLLGFSIFVLSAGSAVAGSNFELGAPNPGFEDYFGLRAVAPVGDVNGDSVPDLLVGALLANAGPIDSGAVYVFSGRTGALLRSLSSPSAQRGGHFGCAVLGLEDLTGDGVAEFAVGADGEGSFLFAPGRVYIYNGATGQVLQTISSPAPVSRGQFGYVLARVPDTNGNGRDELLVGAPREDAGSVANAGRAYLYDFVGGGFGLLRVFEGPSPQENAFFGGAVASGDLDGNGTSDVIIGASRESTDIDKQSFGDGERAGAVHLYSGVDGGFIFAITSPSPDIEGAFGASLAVLDDFTGDGRPELAVGAYAENDSGVLNAGRVYVYSLSAGGVLREFASPRPAGGGGFGISVAGLPDVNGNGAPELLIGAPGENLGCRFGGGRAYLVDADSGELLRTFVSTQPEELAQFGVTLTTLPDLNGDGQADIAVAGVAQNAGFVLDAGKVYVYTSSFLPEGKNKILENCATGCSPTSPDADGDGLSACVETTCLGTSDNLVDSDFDGMPDNFEAQYGLDPLRDDSKSDPDADGIPSLEEFLLNASPVDPNSPARTFFVGEDGDDGYEGSAFFPFRTISRALSAIDGELEDPARIVVTCGTYHESLTLKPFVSVEGAPGDTVVIRGRVVGAANSTLKNVTLESPSKGGGDALLVIANAAMTVSRVTFSNSPGSTGILIINEALTDNIVEQCTFRNLEIGIDVNGSLPFLRRSTFESQETAGLRWQNSLGGPDANRLGDAGDPRTGWNVWRDIANRAVINLTDTQVKVENNDWGTNEPTEINALISGPKDFEPFLAAGSGLLAAALFVTVWDAADQTRITNASLNLSPSGFPPLTENNNGTYAFASVQSGQYQLSVAAEGFATAVVNVTLADAETASITVPLGPPPAEKANANCGCGATGGPRGLAGDAAVVLVLLAVLLGGTFRRGRTR